LRNVDLEKKASWTDGCVLKFTSDVYLTQVINPLLIRHVRFHTEKAVFSTTHANRVCITDATSVFREPPIPLVRVYVVWRLALAPLSLCSKALHPNFLFESSSVPALRQPQRHPPVRTRDRSIINEKPVETDSSSTILDAAVGIDPPIEKAHPGLQPALVFASYPLVLILLVSTVAIYFYSFRSSPRGKETTPACTESTK
jgi:hypothetical protein